MITTEKELAAALKNHQERIEIDLNLGRKIYRIVTLNRVSWTICIASLSIAVITALSGGTAILYTLPILGLAAPVAVGFLGLPAAFTAFTIAVAAGSASALNRLRNYRIIEKEDMIVLIRKK